MRDNYDFSNGRKNPYARKIKEEGYSITVHYSPQDIDTGDFSDTKDIIQALVELMTESDAKDLLAYIMETYDISPSDELRETIIRDSIPVVAEKSVGYKQDSK